MKLTELRKKWEKGLIVKLAVFDSVAGCLLVLLEEKIVMSLSLPKESEFRIHRYFSIGINSKNWEVSVDYEGRELDEALDKITKQFKLEIDNLMED